MFPWWKPTSDEKGGGSVSLDGPADRSASDLDRVVVQRALYLVKSPFADPDRRDIRAFEHYVLELSRLMTLLDLVYQLAHREHSCDIGQRVPFLLRNTDILAGVGSDNLFTPSPNRASGLEQTGYHPTSVPGGFDQGTTFKEIEVQFHHEDFRKSKKPENLAIKIRVRGRCRKREQQKTEGLPVPKQ